MIVRGCSRRGISAKAMHHFCGKGDAALCDGAAVDGCCQRVPRGCAASVPSASCMQHVGLMVHMCMSGDRPAAVGLRLLLRLLASLSVREKEEQA